METLKGKDHQEGAGLLTRSITRRQAIKAGGIAVVGLAFSKPLIETVMPKPAFANYMTNGTNSRGCSPGYWMNHTNNWPAGYNTGDKFSAAHLFDRVINVGAGPSSISDPTLLQALRSPGPGFSILAFHAVAALLNAAHPDVDYAFTEAEVIQKVQDAIDGNAPVESTKNELDLENNKGCTLN